ncbi:hypothetical protein [Roseivivax sp. THAF197b]|uniref:GumK N-terminal domain-containing glycosyltransferase n=1 Tax=Roseivivax sp. THAF197b TaxID=2588299 RepID=UPI001268D735|nr:hypothetical protein [Roseivivax sp. THAF197b]QFS84992.1 UDP-glucuronate:glycolipid 2-beta-glucuronosyltransferase [Roseivivax sp. THAF197b]
MKRAVLLSTHLPWSDRRASFHWIADALVDAGWEVDFATIGYSHLARLKQRRSGDAPSRAPRRGRTCLGPRLHHLFLPQAFHPVVTGSPSLDVMLGRAWQISSRKWVPILSDPISRADVVIVESGLPLALVPLIRRMAPDASITYRINDDVSAMRLPRWLKASEERWAGMCDRLSLASPELARRFDHPNVTLDPMGVPRDTLPAKDGMADPYLPRHPVEAVCAGTSHIDLRRLSDWAQDHPLWRCHIVGRVKERPDALPANLVLHGELPYCQMLDLVAHADVGLAAYRDCPGVEYQRAHSNRIQLYRHYGLPILGPDRLCHPSVPALLGYEQPDAAFRCETWRRRPEALPDWSDLARALVQNVEIEPPFDVAVPPARL